MIRTDIQALRGYAVLLVLFHHAGLPFLPAGYLGVDVFFVLSGYLITRMVAERIAAASFSFTDFYTRRARRLLPAAYSTFLLTALAAVFLLTAPELADFRHTLHGALLYGANFVLWRQSGYFDAAAALKPLLHVWSLSLEEQYYLLLPAFLYFLPRRFWRPASLALFLASFAFALYLAPRSPKPAFYLLPCRAWELAIGSIGALYLSPVPRVSRLFGLALLGLVLIPFLPALGPHPGWAALAISLSTLVLIAVPHPSAARLLPVRFLAWFGDISYSLYLLHWPIYAIVSNLWFGEIPLPLRALLFLAPIPLAWLQYRFIETPFRNSNLRATPISVAALVAVTLLIAFLPFLGSPVPSTDRRINFGLSPDCDFSASFSPLPACRTASNPTVLLWGDSIAMHLAPGLAHLPLLQATSSSCSPLLDFARNPNPSAAQACIDFNYSVLAYLAQPDSPSLVVLSGYFASDLQPASPVSLTLARLRQTVQRLHALGKRVVVVAPPPVGGFDSALCLERRSAGLPVFGPRASCRIPLQPANPSLTEFLDAIPSQTGAGLLRFEPFLCDSHSCLTAIENVPLYRDATHLSIDGSRILFRQFHLAPKILAAAR